MPQTPTVIVASGFRGQRPKAVLNILGVRAVGGVSGVYRLSNAEARRLVRYIRSSDLSLRVVAHSTGFRKLEIGQLNTLVRASHSVASFERG